MKVTANISLPQLHMHGEYVVLGEFQMLPVESTGKMAANFSKHIFLIIDNLKFHKNYIISLHNIL